MTTYCKLTIISTPDIHKIEELEIIIEWPDVINVREIYDMYIKSIMADELEPKLIREGYAHHSGELFYPFHYYKYPNGSWTSTSGIYLGFSLDSKINQTNVNDMCYYVDYAEVITANELNKEMFLDLL